MIIIITGKMNHQKTTTIKEFYNKNQKGDGFVLVKKVIDNQVHSYEATQCSTNEKRILLRHEYFYKNKNTHQQTIGPYIVDESVLTWISEMIQQMIKNNVQPIYLDEIGNWELKGQGFNDILVKLIESNLDLVITVRDSLLSKVIKKYKIIKYKIMKT